MARPLLPCLFQFAIAPGEERLFEIVEFVGGRYVANSAVQPQQVVMLNGGNGTGHRTVQAERISAAER